jgi:ABC-type methionine transport system ATPase subunit
MAAKKKSPGKVSVERGRPGASSPPKVGRKKTGGKAAAVHQGLGKPGGLEVERRRFWLTYPTKLITQPVIWEMTRKFDILFNVRQASVTEEIGILCLEMEAPRERLKKAIHWLEACGVTVEPVEINVIES